MVFSNHARVAFLILPIYCVCLPFISFEVLDTQQIFIPKNLSSMYYVPGTVLGAGTLEATLQKKICDFMGIYSSEEADHKQY